MHRLAFQVMARMETRATKTLNDVEKGIGSNFGGGFPNSLYEEGWGALEMHRLTFQVMVG